MDLFLILEWIVKAGVLLLFCVAGFAYLTFYERRALARIQIRIGPNRAGPSGWLQPAADGIKLIFKEELIPAQAYRIVFLLAPMITVFPALVIMAVIPWGTSITVLVVKFHSTSPTSTWVCFISFRSPRSQCMESY